jgi:hypothetical protein
MCLSEAKIETVHRVNCEMIEAVNLNVSFINYWKSDSE